MKAQELRQKTLKELHSLLEEMREELRKLRFDLVMGKLKNVHKIKETKKDIARILTVINEKQKNKK